MRLKSKPNPSRSAPPQAFKQAPAPTPKLSPAVKRGLLGRSNSNPSRSAPPQAIKPAPSKQLPVGPAKPVGGLLKSRMQKPVNPAPGLSKKPSIPTRAGGRGFMMKTGGKVKK